MATITQLPAALTFNAVAGNPAHLLFNLTITDSAHQTVPWSDVTGYQMDITDQYGASVAGVTPVLTSPSDYQVSAVWTVEQTIRISETLQPRMAFSIFIDHDGPYALCAGQITMTPPEYPSNG